MVSIQNAKQQVYQGRQFADIVRHTTPGQRAVLSHMLRTGTITLADYTLVQALALSKASWAYAVAAHGLDDHERQLVWFGRALIADFIHRTPSDADVDRVIARLGQERVWAALDRATAPTRANAVRASQNGRHAAA